MKILHTDQVSFDLLSAGLQHDLLAYSDSFSSNIAGEIVMLISDSVWQQLIDQHAIDQYVDMQFQSTPWLRLQDDTEVAE